jgi:hypothetical protein
MIFLILLIGEQKELLLRLKIKDNVDHAGLSLQQELLKVLSSSKLVHSLHFLNNILLIVHHHLETKVATVE